jgi:hypothetical protein
MPMFHLQREKHSAGLIGIPSALDCVSMWLSWSGYMILFLFYRYSFLLEYRLYDYLLHNCAVILNRGFPHSQTDNVKEICPAVCKSPLSLPKDV